MENLTRKIRLKLRCPIQRLATKCFKRERIHIYFLVLLTFPMISKETRKSTKLRRMENLFTYIFLRFVGSPHGQKNSITEKKSCLGLELESLKENLSRDSQCCL